MNGIEEREEAEIAKITPVELKEYEESLKTNRDLKNSLDTAEEKGRVEGRVEGRENEKIATIQRLFASGASVDIIAIATGMTEADVKLLINEISKAWCNYAGIRSLYIFHSYGQLAILIKGRANEKIAIALVGRGNQGIMNIL